MTLSWTLPLLSPSSSDQSLFSVMKSTKVQTLGELRMHYTANWWAGLLVVFVYSWSPASSAWRVWHGLATVVDSICRLLWFPEPARYTERVDQVAVSPVRLCILAFSLVFTAYLSNAVVSGKSPFFSGSRSSEAAGIANRPPRSL